MKARSMSNAACAEFSANPTEPAIRTCCILHDISFLKFYGDGSASINRTRFGFVL